MAGPVSLQEAVYGAREVLGSVSPQEMSDWILTTYGMTVKPVIVTVMLGKFLEVEHVEKVKQSAREMADAIALEPAPEKGKRRKKEEKTIPDSSLAPVAEVRANTPHIPGQGGCPRCGSAQYAFRGRRRADPEPGDTGPVMVVKRKCRSCEHEWKTRSIEESPVASPAIPLEP